MPTVARAMVVNAAQLASYSQAKQLVLSTGTALSYSCSLIQLLCCLLNMFIRKNVKYVKTNSSEKDRQMTDLCNCEQILLS